MCDESNAEFTLGGNVLDARDEHRCDGKHRVIGRADMEVLPEEHGMERVVDGIECTGEYVVEEDEGNDRKERAYFIKERR